MQLGCFKKELINNYNMVTVHGVYQPNSSAILFYLKPWVVIANANKKLSKRIA
jgi:hypothetical protein